MLEFRCVRNVKYDGCRAEIKPKRDQADAEAKALFNKNELLFVLILFHFIPFYYLFLQ